jgi:hypothetical protein
LPDDTKHRPLSPPWKSDDDPQRIAALKAQRLDKDMNPLNASTEERKANELIKTEPADSGNQRSSPMKFPKTLVLVAQIIASICGVLTLALPAIATVLTLPGWIGFAVFALGCIAALVAGLDAPSPFHGKPIIYGPAAATAGTLATAIATLAHTMPDGFLKSVLLLAAMLLAGAAGASLPNGTETPPPATT